MFVGLMVLAQPQPRIGLPPKAPPPVAQSEKSDAAAKIATADTPAPPPAPLHETVAPETGD
jgi:hypothetical protein